jgi:hypothetical protein
MGNWMKGLLAGVALSLLAFLAFATGVVSLRWPGPRLPELSRVDVDVALPGAARIAAVEPITLDCRARVRAVVPVEGVREHRFLGQVYRTDRVQMEAIGDVDTCVEGASVGVAHHDDGTTEIVVPAESIRFVRPRVDAPATAGSVRVTKGVVGKVTDVFPWVDETSELLPHGYAYAQHVIGGSACMQAAYAETADALVEGYHRQFAEQGFEPERLRVRIEGRPDFGQNDPPPLPGDIRFSVDTGAVSCIPIPSEGEHAPDR